MTINVIQVNNESNNFRLSADEPGKNVYWYTLEYNSNGFNVLSTSMPNPSPSAIYYPSCTNSFSWGATADCGLTITPDDLVVSIIDEAEPFEGGPSYVENDGTTPGTNWVSDVNRWNTVASTYGFTSDNFLAINIKNTGSSSGGGIGFISPDRQVSPNTTRSPIPIVYAGRLSPDSNSPTVADIGAGQYANIVSFQNTYANQPLTTAWFKGVLTEYFGNKLTPGKKLKIFVDISGSMSQKNIEGDSWTGNSVYPSGGEGRFCREVATGAPDQSDALAPVYPDRYSSAACNGGQFTQLLRDWHGTGSTKNLDITVYFCTNERWIEWITLAMLGQNGCTATSTSLPYSTHMIEAYTQNSITHVLASLSPVSIGQFFPMVASSNPPTPVINPNQEYYIAATTVPASLTITRISASQFTITVNASMPANSNATWQITPWRIAGTSVNITSFGFSSNGTSGTRSGQLSSLSAITVSCGTQLARSTHQVSITIVHPVNGADLNITGSFTFNDSLQIVQRDILPDELVTEAYRGVTPIEDTALISWTSNYPTDNIFYIAGSLTPYTQGTTGLASSYRIMALKATTNDHYSRTYEYTLTNLGDTASATFRPYKPIATNTTITHTINDSENVANDNITKYDITIFGNNGTHNHNLPPNYFIYHQYDTSHIIIEYFLTPIPFNDDVSTSIKVIDVSSSYSQHDRAFYKIINPIANAASELVTSTHTVQVDVLSASPTSTPGAKTTNITLTGYAYPSDTLFKPFLSIDGASPSTSIYRRVNSSSGSTSRSITLSVNSSTILTPTNTPGVVTFWEGSTLIGGTQSFTDASQLRTKSITTQVDETTSGVYEYHLLVDANYYSVPSTQPRLFISKTYSTTLYYLSYIDVTPSDIAVYPQYYWRSGAWKRKVDSNLNLTTETGELFGAGRTENILLSTKSFSGATAYTWTVKDPSNNILHSSVSPTNKILVPIKSACSASNFSINVDLRVDTPDTLNAPCSGNCATKVNALTFRPITATPFTLNPSITIGAKFLVPGPLDVNVSTVSSPTTEPITLRVYSLLLDIQSPYWRTTTESRLNQSAASNDVFIDITLRDIADRDLSIPKFERTDLDITATPNFAVGYTPHPVFNDWCTPGGTIIPGTPTSFSDIQAFPAPPYFYIKNKHVVTDGSNSYDNLVPAGAGIGSSGLIDFFTWTSNNITRVRQDFNSQSYTYNTPGRYSLSRTTTFSNSSININITDNNAIHVYSEYPKYDTNVVRSVNLDISKLPFECGIGSNEWVTDTTINHVFKKIHDNLLFLIDQSKIYDNPPTQYIGWLGTIELSNGSKRFRWAVDIPGLDYQYTNPHVAVDYNERLIDVQDCVVKNNNLYVSSLNPSNNTCTFDIYTNVFAPARQFRTTEQTVGNPFNCIKVIQFDRVDNDRIYFLDSVNPNTNSSKNIILVYSYTAVGGANDLTLLYFWGGLGTASSKNKFRNPLDMFMDLNNTLWVADTDNLVVKNYTRTGTWLSTIYSPYFTEDSKPISLCKDADDNLHVLCSNGVTYVFDESNGYKYNYTPRKLSNNDYFKVRPSVDDGFLYFISKDQTIKVNYTGNIQLPFNNIQLLSNADQEYNLNNKSIFHDEFRNLYIPQGNHILKYADLTKLINLIDTDVLTGMWDINDIFIKKNEYIQDWVVNKSLNRLWDNIEIVRRSIVGKLSYEQNITYSNNDGQISTTPPEGIDVCYFDWWPSFTFTFKEDRPICYPSPLLRTFLPDEYKLPAHKKDDVIIGINEFASADVINRVSCQLQDNLNIIRDMLRLSNDKSDELCDNITIDDIADYDNRSISLSECYPDFFAISKCQYGILIDGDVNPCINEGIVYNAIISTRPECTSTIRSITWSINGNTIGTGPTLIYAFDASTNNVPQTITVTLSAEPSPGQFTTFLKTHIVTPRWCIQTTLSVTPPTVCVNENVTSIATVDSDFAYVSAYRWIVTSGGNTIHDVTNVTSLSTNQFIFNLSTPSTVTIKMEPLFNNIGTIPGTAKQTSSYSINSCIPPSPPDILPDTYLYFIVDDSASFNASRILKALERGVKDKLIRFYNNSEQLYNSRVQMRYINNERTLKWFGGYDALACSRACDTSSSLPLTLPDPRVGNHIIFIFQDEALTSGGPAGYHNNSGDPQITPLYSGGTSISHFIEDMSDLKNRLSSYRDDYFFGVIFAYNRPEGESGRTAFPTFMNKIINDATWYTNNPTYSLYDHRNKFYTVPGIARGDSREIIEEQILNALRNLGFSIP